MTPSGMIASATPNQKRLSRLYEMLINEKKTLESVAGLISDHTLRCTVLSLAQQANQYATELSCYLRTPVSLAKRTAKAVLAATPAVMDEAGIIHFCRIQEQRLVNAYQRFIKEVPFYEDLNAMVSYQLNGLRAAGSQLKLLGSLHRSPVAPLA